MAPIYEFKCQSCEHVTESWQKHDDPAPVCETCAAETKRQIAGGTDFILKGNQEGYYGKSYTNRYLGGTHGLQSRKARKNK